MKDLHEDYEEKIEQKPTCVKIIDPDEEYRNKIAAETKLSNNLSKHRITLNDDKSSPK